MNINVMPTITLLIISINQFLLRVKQGQRGISLHRFLTYSYCETIIRIFKWDTVLVKVQPVVKQGGAGMQVKSQMTNVDQLRQKCMQKDPFWPFCGSFVGVNPEKNFIINFLNFKISKFIFSNLQKSLKDPEWPKWVFWHTLSPQLVNIGHL